MLIIEVIDPARQLAFVDRADGSQAKLDVDDALRGDDVLPNFMMLARHYLLSSEELLKGAPGWVFVGCPNQKYTAALCASREGEENIALPV